MSKLNLPVNHLEGVGMKRTQLLGRLGIHTIQDLLFHFPIRYEDRSRLIPLGDLTDGQQGTYWGVVVDIQELRPRPKLSIFKVLLDDGTGQAYAVWYNQTYQKRMITIGTRLTVFGRSSIRHMEKTIAVSDFEVLPSTGEEEIEGQGIVPVYSLTKGLSQRVMRQLIQQALAKYLQEMPDILPPNLKKFYRLTSKAQALRQIHCPKSISAAERSRKMLAYEELLLWQLALQKDRASIDQEEGIAHQKTGCLVRQFLAQLPFSLTKAQQRVVAEIFHDMEQNTPMARLLQGDVGSGKTVVALLGLLKAIDNGYQGALMVPTEILAEQHYLNIKRYVAPLGVKTALATSSLSRENREEIKEKLSSGQIQLIVGTHALIQEDIEFANLGLAVIDEQHRFGVSQRGKLLVKGKSRPDLLIMTATPIPRTLALTFYGDLDFSVIDELPPGRQPVITRYVPEKKREEAYDFIKEHLRRGKQAYIVCPLVDESDKIQAEAALTLYEELTTGAFREYRVGLVYGKMPAQLKEQVMDEFRQGELDLLVATTVIEVGVDVPNATVILITGCERFGLAQLHQLRGRVGRGQDKSYCLLMGRLNSKEAQGRIKALLQHSDGFTLAEEDLKLRGPGDFFGVRQHGMPQFKAADLLRDQKILQLAQRDARLIINHQHKLEYKKLLEFVQQQYDAFLP